MKNLYEKISSFGWQCQETDGHDQRLLRYAIKTPTDRPKCIILNTVKGKGIDILENSFSWILQI